MRPPVPLLTAAALLLVATACGGDGSEGADDGTTGGTGILAEGRAFYEGTCAACHGTDLEGTDLGPPFLSPIYAPNHHPDESFFRAVAQGVQPHHWDFDAMPPVPGMDEDEVRAIVAYVRSVQQEHGILEDPTH